jgi:3-hydroxyacyl-[acyl-carrier-protein] dehydratase
VFAGHFPEIHVWPGVYVIEGLGQSCNLLEILVALEEGWVAHGGTPDDLLAELRNLELGYRLQPGFRVDASAHLLQALRETGPRMGFAAAVEMRFLLPVFGGQRIDYHVRRTHLADNITRHEVEAEVEGRLVARGVMHGAMAVPVPQLPRR